MRIEKFHIGMEQTWKGKMVCSMSGSELLDMQRSLREKCEIGEFVYELGGTGEVHIEFAPEEPKRGSNMAFNIGGKHYGSLEELKKAIGAGNLKGVTVFGSGKTIIKNGTTVTMGGQTIYNLDEDTVCIFVEGNAGNVECDNGSVYVIGDAEDVETNNGSIHAHTIIGNAETNCGSIHAQTIHGKAEANMGSIYYKK